MPSLTVRDIPDAVLKRMRKAAKQQRRSLNAQALSWLEQSAEQRMPADLDGLLERIRTTRESIRRKHGKGSDSSKLVQAMRRRGKP